MQINPLFIISTAGALRIWYTGDFHPTAHPHITFQHLSLYVQRHLGQSVTVCGKVDHSRPGRNQIQPGTVRMQSKARQSGRKLH